MKIRTGFVSNSSSCSFTIYGIELHDSVPYELEKKLEAAGLEIMAGEWDYYVGLVICGENEHEMMGICENDHLMANIVKLKEKVRKVLKEFYPDTEIGLWSESWYNG